MEIRQTILRNIAERVARIVVSSRKFGAIYLRSGGEGSWTPVLVAIHANIYMFIRR